MPRYRLGEPYPRHTHQESLVLTFAPCKQLCLLAKPIQDINDFHLGEVLIYFHVFDLEETREQVGSVLPSLLEVPVLIVRSPRVDENDSRSLCNEIFTIEESDWLQVVALDN